MLCVDGEFHSTNVTNTYILTMHRVGHIVGGGGTVHVGPGPLSGVDLALPAAVRYLNFAAFNYQ